MEGELLPQPCCHGGHALTLNRSPPGACPGRPALLLPLWLPCRSCIAGSVTSPCRSCYPVPRGCAASRSVFLRMFRVRML